MSDIQEVGERAKLAPEVSELIERIDAMMASVMAQGPMGGGTFAQLRAAALAATQEIFDAAGGVESPVHSEVDHAIRVEGGEIAARSYTPAGDGPFPAYLHFHGGAWVMGSIDWPTFRSYAREMCERSGYVVLDVDYRLAPEHQFPVGLEDCYASLVWLAEHAEELNIDRSRLVVGGDSAGGALAASVCLLARDRGGPHIAAQLLEVPVGDAIVEDYPSATEFGIGYGLDTAGLVAGRALYYATPDDALDPLASPIRAESLAGLPPAYIFTAEFDPLRDNGEAYGAKLRQAGVPTVVSRQSGHIHGASFLLHPKWEGARNWRDEVADALIAVAADGPST